MKLAVVYANGRVGTLVVKEAVERGLDVTAVVREKNKTAAKKVIQKDLFDLTADDLDSFDAVVDAFGAWAEEALRKRDDVQWTFISPAADIIKQSICIDADIGKALCDIAG